jgi:ADP-ribose pyrophosphatase YjhB (NUDIX family)
MKRVNGRAIIIDGDEIILMFRRKIKDGKVKEYYAIPGGGKEENETIEECVKREINEEFNLDVEVKEFLGKVEDDKNIGYIYNAAVVVSNRVPQGEAFIVKAGALGIELKRNTNVESDRDILKKTTVYAVDKHYAAYLRDKTKVVRIAQ